MFWVRAGRFRRNHFTVLLPRDRTSAGNGSRINMCAAAVRSENGDGRLGFSRGRALGVFECRRWPRFSAHPPAADPITFFSTRSDKDFHRRMQRARCLLSLLLFFIISRPKTTIVRRKKNSPNPFRSTPNQD